MLRYHLIEKLAHDVWEHEEINAFFDWLDGMIEITGKMPTREEMDNVYCNFNSREKTTLIKSYCLAKGIPYTD